MNTSSTSDQSPKKPAPEQSITFDALNTGVIQSTGSLDADMDSTKAIIDAEERQAHSQLLASRAAKSQRRRIKFGVLTLVVLVGLGLAAIRHNVADKTLGSGQADASQRFSNTSIPIFSLDGSSGGLAVQNAQTLSVNGQLNVNNSLVIAPAAKPSTAVPGQLYFDQTSKELSYYNGSSFVPLTQNIPAPTGVLSVGSANGAIGVGGGLSVSGSTLSNTGVLSVGSTSGNIGLGGGLAISAGTLSNTGVLTVQGQAGNVTLTGGPGIVVSGTALSNSGLLSLAGQTGDITLGAGLGMSGNQLRNTGIISAVGAGTVTVTNDGNGNITIDAPTGGGGGGTVVSPGGTINKIAKFTGVQTIADSLMSDNGTAVTVGGDLSVTGNVSLTNALTVTNGGTGATTAAGARTNLSAAKSGANSDITSLSGLTTALSVAQGGIGVGTLATNGVILGNGTSPLTSAVAGSSGQCLVSTAGAPTWQSCPGAGGVSSLDGGTGALILNNSSLSGSNITIDNASTAAKGIASFNATNFSVVAGAVNTIQNINTAAAPTFGQLTLTSSQAANPMFVVNNTNLAASGSLLDLQLNGTSKFSVSPAGNMVSSGTLNGQTISAAANFTGTVAVGTTLSVNTITPTSSLTIGSTGQSFLLQGNASSTLTATNGASTTTLGFQSPTANVTYNFPTAAAGTYNICTTVGNCAGVGGGVTTAGGTTNKLAKFTAGTTIGDSIITDNGSTVTIGGTLSVNTLTPTGALTVGGTGQNLTLQGATVSLTATSAGITNSLTFATPSSSNKTITIPNATGTVAVSATGPIALDAAGNLTCPTCLTSGGGGGSAGVSSVNSLTGALTLQGASAGSVSSSATTITINDATSAVKGLASFNATNFSVSSGAVNTIQDIATTSAPSFGQLTLTSSQAANPMLVVNNTNVAAAGNLLDLKLNGTSKFSVAPSGNVTTSGTITSGTINGQTISNSASFTGSVTTSTSLTVGTTLNVNTITPSSSLTIGATGQSFTLQGNASSSLTATNAGNTTTVNFQSPTANVSYRFAAAAAGNYDICTAAGNCLGGAAGGANTALSNLTTTSINQSLIANANNSLDIGSSGTAWRSGYFGSSVLTPLVDTISASALNIGTTNATSISLNQSTFVSGSNTFTVGTGLTTLGGGLAVTAGSSDFTNSLAAKKGTDYSTTGTSNNVSFSNTSLVRLTGASAQTITGIANGRDGYILTMVNAGSNAATISNNSGSSSAANRIITGTGSDITLNAGGSISLVYDSGASLWRITGSTATTGGGVSSVNSLVGALTIANASTSSSTITIDNAKADGSTKGIAAFNSTNFSDNGSGVINTIQGIATTSTPTFAGVNTNTITPSAALTVGATGQAFTLQGNASSVITATGGGFTTSVGFSGTPTAAVTYNFDRSASSGTYTICTTSGNCLGGGSGGANTALSNLTTTSINQSLIANANNANDIGSSGTAWRSGYFGTSVLAPLVDTISAGALNIGTTNATSISLNQNTSVSGSKTFTVGTGLTSLGGGLAVTSGSSDFTNSLATKKGTDFSTTGSSNNVSFSDASLVRLTGASAQTITGIANGRDGYRLTIVNAAGQAATISNNSGSSSAANRIITGTGSDITLNAGASVSMIYDSGASLWRVTGGVATTGGGVVSVNGLVGALTISNASAAGSTITINDAKADGSTKGIAAFNSTNFTDSSGVINTVQNINTGATPTFAGLTLTGALQGTTASFTNANSLSLGTASTSTGSIKLYNSGSANSITLQTATETVGNATVTIPNTAGAADTVCLLTLANCLGGASGGANTALSNLTATSINQSLIANANNSLDLGSSGTAWRTSYFATSALSPLFDSISGAVSVGTSTATGVTIGGTTNTTAVTLQGAASATYTIGTSSNTGGVTLGNSTDSNTIAIGNGNTATGKTQTINIGAGTDAGTGKAVVTVGNTNGASSLLLQAGTGNLQIQTQGGTLGVGNNAVAQTIAIGNSTGGTGVTLTSGSGGITLTGSTTVSGSNTFTSGTGAVSLQGATTVSANLIVTNAGSLQLQKATDYSTTGTSNDVNLGTASLVRLTGASAQTITGISGGADGRVLTIMNAGSSAATISNSSVSSSAANRILTGTAADITLNADGAVTLVYDSGASRWRVAGSAAVSASGNFINNNTTQQAAANFNIAGTGKAANFDATTGALGIGNSVATSITYGNTANTASMTFQGTTAATYTIGTSTGTGAITLGQSTASNTIAIGNAATAAGNTQTINIGTGSTSTGKDVITIGSTNDGSSLTLQAGTGNLTMLTNSASASIIAKSSTNGTTAFQIQNSSAVALLNADTSGGKITVAGTADNAFLIIKQYSAQAVKTPEIMFTDSSGNETSRINVTTNGDMFFGYQSGSNFTGNTGTTIGIGINSLASVTTGQNNTALGVSALNALTTTNGNTAVGYGALSSSTGANNTATGIRALGNVGLGDSNAAVGNSAGFLNGTSTSNFFNNVFIGDTSGSEDGAGFITLANIHDAAAIGAEAQVQASNTLVLGAVDTGTTVNGSFQQQVVIGTTMPTSTNVFGVSPLIYSFGSASQSGTTITGTGSPAWLSSGIKVGMHFIFADGTDAGTITAITNDTHLTVTTNQTVASQSYRVHNPGFQITSTGDAYESTTSTTAFLIQNASATTLFTADTTNSTIKVSGTTSTFAVLQIDNAHFKSTQTTAPTIGTPSSCGTSPTASVTAGSTDSAGKVTINSGSSTTGVCTTVITFNKAYGGAPKSVILTGADGTSAAKTVAVTATGTTSFTIALGASSATSTSYNFYYWVIE